LPGNSARMLVPKFRSRGRHGVFRWSKVTVTVRAGVCVLTPSPRVHYMTQIWLKSKMSSTSHFPKEFRNTLARQSAIMHWESVGFDILTHIIIEPIKSKMLDHMPYCCFVMFLVSRSVKMRPVTKLSI